MRRDGDRVRIAHGGATLLDYSAYDAWRAGTVRKQGGRKAVEIRSLGITFDGDTLQVR